MIAVVDYGMGNLRSVAKALERVGAEVEVTADPDCIAAAAGVVLPGVGAFGRCMENLRAAGLEAAVRRAARSDRPFLGVCVGMQILFDESEEFGPVRGLGILRGRVRRFRPGRPDLKVPHMGWNRLTVVRRSPLLRGVPEGSFAYFVHSYYVDGVDPAIVTTTTDYGREFVSSVQWRNLYATQFHPEKSQAVGLRMLANFAALCGYGGASP
ncbi:MAG: imidazole glycerol phosphate synthase subunit HisH [Candidatus Dadabacteria bacterium]|nr:MAG: imidazole glycerol phosphate synthase subunit HisH [Candidatus Dadabacteria bacterium]